MFCHIVTAANRDSYRAVLKDMFRQRHDAFVDLKGWSELQHADGMEMDEFDGADAVYLLVINDIGELEASLRLTPSERPHLLAGLAESWGIRERPYGFGVWEWSRYLPGRPGASRQRLAQSRAILITGALEFARSRGVSTYIACCDVKRFNMFTELGWQLEFLSEVIDYGQGRAAAIKWAVGQAELDFARAHFGFTRSVSMEMPPRPAASNLHYLHFAVASELWELDAEKLGSALIDITRHSFPRPKPARGAPIIVPGLSGRA